MTAPTDHSAGGDPTGRHPTGSPRPTVWVAVHDLTRSGVPIVLERLLRASGPSDRARVHVVALRGGPMERRIAAVSASVTVLEPEQGRSGAGGAVAAVRSFGLHRVALSAERSVWTRRLRSVPPPTVVVVHGAGAWPIVAIVAPEVPVVLHLHELDTALDRCIAPADRPAAFARSSAVMVVSRPVADLARRDGARGDSVVSVPGVIDTSTTTGTAAVPTAAAPSAAAVPSMGRGEAGSRVFGAGTPGWRKGTDRMASLAFELQRRGLDTSVGWVGGAPSGVDAAWVDADDPVRWFPATDDPWAVLRSSSVFVVPSREDPLPLVALEAGHHRLPVVATPSGGLVDLLADGRGLVTEGHDLRSLSDLTERVLRSPALAHELGSALGDHVERHHDPAVVAPIWWDVIDGAAR